MSVQYYPTLWAANFGRRLFICLLSLSPHPPMTSKNPRMGFACERMRERFGEAPARGMQVSSEASERTSRSAFAPTASPPAAPASPTPAIRQDVPADGPARKRAKTKAGGASAPRARTWCFTIFSLVSAIADPDAFAAALSALDSVVYVCLQREVAPGTGRKHIQGFIAFEHQKSLSVLKNVLGDPSAHCEMTRGTNSEASDYCKKDESRDPAAGSGPFEHGVLPKGQGKRMDLLAVKADIDSGMADADVAQTHFSSWIRYHKAFNAYRTLITTSRSSQTECIVLWGPPGSGKTRAATVYDTPSNTFFLPRPNGSTAWWDGYSGQRTVVLDEFYGWLRRDFLQRLIDRTPLRVEVKGGSLCFVSHTVIITSNNPPDLWYPRVGLGAMQRRLEEPIGAVLYVGSSAFPTEASYRLSLPSTVIPSADGKSSHAAGYVPYSDQSEIGGF